MKFGRVVHFTFHNREFTPKRFNVALVRFLSFLKPNFIILNLGIRPNEGVKERYTPLSRAKIGQISRYISETVQDRKLSYNYSHVGSGIRAFHWCQISDLEWPWTTELPLFCLISPNFVALGPMTSQWLEFDQHCLQHKCTPKTESSFR